MAISQFIPALRVGYLYTYWGPLIFVLFITMVREAIDDIRRWKRDREVNMAAYTKLTQTGNSVITSAKIKVGDMIWLDKNQTIPADMVLLYTTEKNGACFIRTDQLDGETDWKLRTAVPITQEFVIQHENKPQSLMGLKALIHAEKPNQNIYSFEGLLTRKDVFEDPNGLKEIGLGLENTLWSNTVLATGSAIGEETRAVMNSSPAKSKYGLLDKEINNITKMLILFVILLSFVMVGLKGFTGRWPIYYWRFFLLFSYIIPLALRVNLDLAKIVYALLIQRDAELRGTVVRSTTISEELGRISYLMSDKTGTLTQNEMIFKKLNLGTITYSNESMDELELIVRNELDKLSRGSLGDSSIQTVKSFNQEKVTNSVLAIAICHNVTPMAVDETKSDATQSYLMDPIGYQASSPDEVALVNWTASIGVTLVARDQTQLVLRLPDRTTLMHYEILNDFPFSSETKRMGIIVREKSTKKITLYVKGADVVVKNMVKYSPWLMEEVGNLAREALRTLVVASKSLNDQEYQEFATKLRNAKAAMDNRSQKVNDVVNSLMQDLDLLCLTGVEDKLQENVRTTLESLRNAGIKIWMLTGDKMETAECIARSSRLVTRNQNLHMFPNVSDRNEAHMELNIFRRRGDACLVISGNSLEICLQFYKYEFMELAKACPAVIICRCSPTQKAEVVKLVRWHTGKIVAAIGDGGNDVSMIQEANVGIGLEGKEGKQASLASDFSLPQFQLVMRLLLVHGRNCYKNTCNLGQFVMHRGIIISVMQAVFSAVYFFVAIQLFPGILMVGYATIFTMFPVFSLVLDKDIPDATAMTFPELYRDLQKGRDLTFKTFFLWFLVSVYQGAVIMYGAILLFEDDFIHVVAITFTSLVLTELLMVALTVRTWHWLMIFAEFLSLAIYVVALAVLRNYFDPLFLQTWTFVWKVSLITAVSCIPLMILKLLRIKLRPSIYSRLK